MTIRCLALLELLLPGCPIYYCLHLQLLPLGFPINKLLMCPFYTVRPSPPRMTLLPFAALFSRAPLMSFNSEPSTVGN